MSCKVDLDKYSDGIPLSDTEDFHVKSGITEHLSCELSNDKPSTLELLPSPFKLHSSKEEQYFFENVRITSFTSNDGTCLTQKAPAADAPFHEMIEVPRN